MKEQSSTASPNWGQLNYDILVQIFLKLNIMEVISNVSFVCHSWRAACGDKLLWKTLDLSNLPYGKAPCRWGDDKRKLMTILKRAASLCGDHVTCLIFNYFLATTDEHLVYIAKRCPNIKKLSLPARNYVTVDGFRQAIECWPGLESMTAANIYDAPHIMQIIGEKCKNFFELKVACPFSIEFANAIVAFTPRIKILTLRYSLVYKEPLSIVLNGLHELQVLDVSHSILFGILRPPGPLTIDDDEMDDKIFQKAKTLFKFFCEKNSCPHCRSTCEDMQDWYLRREELWKMDSMNSLSH